MITARPGLENGREVMANPGSVFRDEYKGADASIKQGAKLVENIADIVSTVFRVSSCKPKEPVNIEMRRTVFFGYRLRKNPR